MTDKPKEKMSVTLEIDVELLEHLENAIWYLPPGWDQARLFEVGVKKLLEQLARKYNKGSPFPPRSSLPNPAAATQP
jgi:hypothetical protein